MHVLLVASEIHPFCLGGAWEASPEGTLVGSLAHGLHALGIRVSVIAPYYSVIPGERFGLARRLSKVAVPLGDGTTEISWVDGDLPGTDAKIIFVDHPPSFDRPGLYGDPEDYPDNHLRFNLLCRSAAVLAQERNIQPDVIHAFGWQTGLLPLILSQGLMPGTPKKTKRVFSIHDARFNGLMDPAELPRLGLGPELFQIDGIEFYGRASLLKAGVMFSDVVCAPSLTYRDELCTEEHGAGLHGLFASLGERLVGIPTGLDYRMWNTESNHRLAATYSHEDPSRKAECKKELQSRLELPLRPAVPLVALFASSTDKDGMALVRDTLATLPDTPLQMVLVGGQAADVGPTNTQQPSLQLGHLPKANLDTTQRVLAGADAVWLPQRQYSGGQFHLAALRFGAIPIATAVGGLRETLVDYDCQTQTGTASLAARFETNSMRSAFQRLLSVYGRQDDWLALLQNAMRQRMDIELMSKRYVELYQTLCKTPN